MDFVTAITLATKSLETIKAIRNIDKQLGEADLKAKAAELLSNVADLIVALVEAREEAAKKDEQIRQLKFAFQLREECVRQGNYLYAKSADGKPSGWPTVSAANRLMA